MGRERKKGGGLDCLGILPLSRSELGIHEPTGTNDDVRHKGRVPFGSVGHFIVTKGSPGH